MPTPETCKLLGWWCGHFQIADPLLKTRVLRRATCEKLTSVQELWHFQNPSCSCFHGHGRRSWSHGSTKIQPCNPSFQCLFGLTIVYKLYLVQLILYTMPERRQSTFSWAFVKGKTVHSSHWITEHKRAVSMFNHDSKFSYHVHKNNHNMDWHWYNMADG